MNDHADMTRAELTRALLSLESDPKAPNELRHVLRELQRHQLELEVQNHELQAAHKALEESRNRYMELYDFAPMACVSLNELACIQDLNLTGAALLRQDRASLQGLPFTPFVHPSDVSRFLLHVRQCIAGETASTELRLRIEGRQLEVRLHSAPLQDGVSRGRMCRTAILDITELRQMQLRLSLVERLAAVGTIAAGIAHEINNPLAFLMANLELAMRTLQAQDPKTQEQAPPGSRGGNALADSPLRLLADSQSGAERIRDIVKDLSSFARPTEKQSSQVNVQRVLELSVKMAMVEIRHRATVVRDYSEAPEIVADGAQLGQVFLNLLVNAAQSIPEGTAHQNEIRLRIRASEQDVLVQIQDTGEGMFADVLEHIFDPFFSTKPAGRAMGLGLAISHSLVTQMGGNITVESQPGRGSTFSVRLPAAPPLRASPAVLAPREKPAASPQRKRILIVDDEPQFGRTLRMLLATAHEATYTPSAREALTWIQEGNRYDAILCDLMMAEVTGRQFYEDLCQHSPELAHRVIFMTGGAYTPASLDFVARMTAPLLTKPFKPVELEKVLGPMLAAV
ncbi:hybrid sensor histidine kinase/response regulator [Hyalangium sp.]|uniref:hybrid sensor histidine kinase/response regulator n=1 Tax=Hyalangium sp. TaxID=2028555 RepID=UPI002D2430BB|nr:ATP-binding protein [Hyalangium sp.]HYI00289.1 ATP-binding protein [Hyalangium sp.]